MSEPQSCVIVDDHEVVRAGMRARLDSLEWLAVVGEAASAADAVTIARRERPSLMLMDVRLPGEDGRSAMRTILQHAPDTRIVMYSGYATTAMAEEALEAGAAGFVLKDSAFSMVVDALRTAGQGRRYLDPSIAADIMAANEARRLSPRELEILRMMADGGQNATIAHELSISVETVKAHVSNLLVKFDASGRTDAVAKALREGVID